MAYVLGDTVVHPQHGAAIVSGLVKKDLGQGPIDYVQLRVEHSAMQILVPAAAIEEVGIRDVSTREEAEEILSILKNGADVPDRWVERNATTVTRMKSGDLREVAMVVRDLTQHATRTGKALSSNEKAALDTCIERLSRELALSLEIPEDEMHARIVALSETAEATG